MRPNEVVIKGVVEIVFDKEAKEFKGKTFNEQKIILGDNSNAQYPKKIAVVLKGHAIEKLAEGQEVSLVCSIESREWKGRWFTEVSCWNV